ncbi:CRISPR-associated endonuclease Cas2 [bacterium]|nr:MAG: CRISPR-associated endonuclease Cas2 [bacterium]
MEVTYLVIYDITDDSLRNKVSDTLEDYGLERIQYSAFIGRLKRHRLGSLVEDLKTILNSKKATIDEKRNIQIFPLFELNLKTRIIIDANGGRKDGSKKNEEKRSVHIY